MDVSQDQKHNFNQLLLLLCVCRTCKVADMFTTTFYCENMSNVLLAITALIGLTVIFGFFLVSCM